MQRQINDVSLPLTSMLLLRNGFAQIDCQLSEHVPLSSVGRLNLAVDVQQQHVVLVVSMVVLPESPHNPPLQLSAANAGTQHVEVDETMVALVAGD